MSGRRGRLRGLISTMAGHMTESCVGESIAACLQIGPPSILRARCRQIATMRMPPESIRRSPMLNSPSRAWSARNGSRVFDVAARHIGLAGSRVEGIPTTGIVPSLAAVTRPFSISPPSTSRTPARIHRDRTARIMSHRIAQDSHSQIPGY